MQSTVQYSLHMMEIKTNNYHQTITGWNLSKQTNVNIMDNNITSICIFLCAGSDQKFDAKKSPLRKTVPLSDSPLTANVSE